MALHACESRCPAVPTSARPAPRCSALRRSGRGSSEQARLQTLRYAAPHLASPDAFRARVQAVLARPRERVFGDETADEAHARFRVAVGAVMRAHHGNVAIVTHGTVMALLVAREHGRDPAALWNRLSDLSILTMSWD